MLPNTFMYFLSIFFFLIFHHKICVFIILISFSDKVSNFHNGILTNLKLELVVSSCQRNCMIEFVSTGKLSVNNYKLINIWNAKFSVYFANTLRSFLSSFFYFHDCTFTFFHTIFIFQYPVFEILRNSNSSLNSQWLSYVAGTSIIGLHV